MSQQRRRGKKGPKSHLVGGQKPEYVGLSRRVVRLLNGEGWERYESRYKAHLAIVTGMVAAGWNDEQIFRELSNPSRCEAASILKDKHGGSLVSQIRSKIGIARTEVKKHRADIDSWVAEFMCLCPRKRSGSLVRLAVALAFISREAGSRTFTASVRQIAEVAGLGTATPKGADTKTARKLLIMLSELGFISRRIRTTDDENEPKVMNEITLKDLSALLCPTTPTETPWNSEVVKFPSYVVGRFLYEELLHPLWEHSGLGLNAFRIWVLLRSRGDLTVREIADTLEMASSQVRSILRTRLEEYGLAILQEDGRWRWCNRDLDDVAENLGVLDRPDLRARAFEIQRQNRNRVLSALATRQPNYEPETVENRDLVTGEIFRESVVLDNENQVDF